MIRLTHILALAAVMLPLIAQAHQGSDSFLVIDTSGDGAIDLDWSIPLRDLEIEPGLDMNNDAKVTRAEFEQRSPLISAYALQRLTLSSAGTACELVPRSIMPGERAGQPVAILSASASCASRNELTLDYDLFFDIDSSHRGLVRVITADSDQTSILSPDRPGLSIEHGGSLGRFVLEGIYHIAIGYDHIAFLILLLLPAALKRTDRGWTSVRPSGQAAIDVLGIVTAFTIAHSVTLGLAAAGLVRIPIQIAEVLIALSVIAAALINFTSTTARQRQGLAFGFGLIHGFGFASVFSELGTGGAGLIPVLLSFNIGVELGQLAIVLLLLPAIILLSRKAVYRSVGLPVASAAAGLLGFAWLLQRI